MNDFAIPAIEQTKTKVVRVFVNPRRNESGYTDGLNGFGRLDGGYIKQYDGIFPSQYPEDTYSMLDSIEEQIANGDVRGRTYVRNKLVIWRVETWKE